MKHISKNIKHRLLYINMLFLCGILSGACNKENEPDITPPSEGEQSNPVEMTFTQYTNMVLDSCYRQGIYRRK